LVSAWGYGPQGAVAQTPSEEDLQKLLPAVGWEKVEIGPDDASLRKTHPLVTLDLGSVLQGYAVDQLAGILDAAGVNEYLIEVGGELRARGSWSVAIENPADASAPLARVELRDAALATSGLGRARRKVSGLPVSHILSPTSGRPVETDVELVSVRATSCLEADGWATALIASGADAARGLAHREGLTIWLLESSGRFSVPTPEGQF
jgi:thiamine biosynthesis lipoprotein